MDSYCTRALEGASPVELVVALYDGMIRFLCAAVEAVDQGDVRGRRTEVKRALDIILHLQAQLRMDVGGEPAQALSEFYATIFAQILQASHFASRKRFEHAINWVRNVREAWRKVANDNILLAQSGADAAMPVMCAGQVAAAPFEGPRWTA
jgi:flagellar protein FliS